MGVATGFGCKEYRFPHTTYPVLFVITYYVLNNLIFAQYRHTYGKLRASHNSHMKAAHTVLYMRNHTQIYASYPAMDISCMSVV